ncbi:MAG: FliO/MopB family protein [Phycisphaeraceae bacterium]
MQRQLKTTQKQFFCAMALLSLLCFSMVALPVQAQDTAKRIEEMRDQAADATVVDESAGAAESEADVIAEVEEPLPANELLPLGAGEGDLFSGQGNQAGESSMGDGWLLSTLAALGVVLAIVFGIRWLLKRGGVVSTATPQGGIVEVLSRTTVAPRSHVILMRVGSRILIVSDSTTGMRTLASVQDAEEVAELLGTIDSAKSTSMTQNFGSVMKKLSGQWSAEDDVLDDASDGPVSEPSAALDQAEGALSRVRGRLAALSDTGGRA